MTSQMAGIIAIAAGGVAALALLICLILALRLRRLRAAQTLVLGSGHRDLVSHAEAMERGLEALGEQVRDSIARLERRDAALDAHLQGAIAHFAVIRYDAMGEMSGRQSSSVALLDSDGRGVVLSSILHRDQARLYAKPIIEGRSEYELSPEEQEALRAATELRD